MKKRIDTNSYCILSYVSDVLPQRPEQGPSDRQQRGPGVGATTSHAHLADGGAVLPPLLPPHSPQPDQGGLLQSGRGGGRAGGVADHPLE